jgi:spermidine/putrescine-binding protein
LDILNWPFYIPDEVLSAFESRHGCTLRCYYFYSPEECLAWSREMQGVFDIVFPDEEIASRMRKLGLLERLDGDKLPNVRRYLDPRVAEKRLTVQDRDYSVPYLFGRTGFMLDIERFPHPERAVSWSLFEDAELKGKVTALDDERIVLGAALAELGYSVNSASGLEIKEAAIMVGRWARNIRGFLPFALQDHLIEGQVLVAHCYPENVWYAIDEKQAMNERYADRYRFVLPARGPASLDLMAIPASSPDKDLAYAFIDFIYEPEIARLVADFIRMPSVHVAAQADPLRAPNYSIEDALEGEIIGDVGEARALYDAAWMAIRN